jgi:alpha-beta hydrolase superfamily lysophospholipase
MNDANRPSIVLVHGLWLTPRSWEHWVQRYSDAGHDVQAPAWPGMEVEVDALRKDPSVMNGLGVGEIADHYERLIRAMDSAPIIMGHSFGGAVTQILLDRGLGVAGVALHPAPVKGVLRLPFNALRASFPVLGNPANRKRTVMLTHDQWHFAFTNNLDEHDSRAAYERYAVPGPGRPLFQAASANLVPNAATKVNFRNAGRAPLLVVGCGHDHTVPESLAREAYTRQRKSGAVTELKIYPDRSHFTAGEPGWEDVADHALEWALGNGKH